MISLLEWYVFFNRRSKEIMGIYYSQTRWGREYTDKYETGEQAISGASEVVEAFANHLISIYKEPSNDNNVRYSSGADLGASIRTFIIQEIEESFCYLLNISLKRGMFPNIWKCTRHINQENRSYL